jgi:hypothetical protein
MLPWVASVGCVLVVGLFAGSARAEPYFAQREGYRCSKCHFNKTGGGMRTAFGRQWAWTNLSLTATEDLAADSDDPDRRVWWTIDPAVNDHLSFGADVRVVAQTSFADETQFTFTNPESNLYVALEALEFLAAYFDVSFAEGNVEAREAFLLLQGAGLRLKGGIILLPYGLRIWGEEQFIRSVTGFTYSNPDLGFEVGYENGGFGVFVAVTNGAGGGLDADQDKRVSAVAEYAGRWWRIGSSLSINRTEQTEDFFFGGHAGLTLGRLTLLGEVDRIRTQFIEANQSVEGLVAFAEADFLVLRGLNLKVIYGYHDPALDVDEDQRFNIRSGVEVFIVPMLASRLFYDFRDSVPTDEVGNADVLLFELHVYM